MSPLRGPAWNRSHSCGRTRVPTYDAAFLPFSPGTCSAAVFCQVPSFSSSSVPYSRGLGVSVPGDSPLRSQVDKPLPRALEPTRWCSSSPDSPSCQPVRQPPGHGGEASQEQWTHPGVDYAPVHTECVLHFPQPALPLKIPPTNSDRSYPPQEQI